MNRTICLVLSIAVFTILLAGCAGNTDSGAPSKATLSEDEIIAWVNNEPIPKKLMEDMIAQMPPYLQNQLKSAEGMKNMVENLVNVELIFQKAIEIGFDKEQAVLDKISQVKKQVIYAEYLQKQLKEAGDPNDAAARKFYEENPEMFGGANEVKASHILFKVADDGSDDSKKREACEKLLPDAQKSGADFAALAKKYSESPSKDSGGDLGFFQKNMMAKPISEAAFSMSKGDVRGCIKSQYGYHIMKKTDEKSGAAKPFEEVKAQIVQLLSRQGQQAIFTKIVAELKEGATVKYNDKLIGSAPATPSLPTQDMVPSKP